MNKSNRKLLDTILIGAFAGCTVIVIKFLAKTIGKYLYSDDKIKCVGHYHNNFKAIECNDIIEGKVKTYTRLDESIFEELRKLGISKVLEMCAGKGHNLSKFQEAGFEVIGYDLVTLPDLNVKYGPCGTIEDQYPDYLLYLGSSIDGEKSVEKFTGKYVMIGGWGKDCEIVNIDIVNNLNEPKSVESASMISYREPKAENRKLALDCRPKSNFMIEKGFKLINQWFLVQNEDDNIKWSGNIWVQQLWERKDPEPLVEPIFIE
jgi:hypothetical protein